MFCSLLLAATVAVVKSSLVGDVTVSCKDGAGWSFSAGVKSEGAAEIITIDLDSPAERRPPRFDVDFSFSGADIHHVWSTDFSRRDNLVLWPNLWNDGKRYYSQLAREAPLLAALNANDRARFTMAASDAFNKVLMRMDVHERTCRMHCGFTFFPEVAAPAKTRRIKIRIDRRDRFWADAVRDACEWISVTAGFNAAPVPEAAFDPLYSTWYAYLQDVRAPQLEREAELAASLGMKTMILDDGWQKEKSVSFYSAVGDWMPVKSRFPDMKAHVKAVHDAGLKYMLWLSVPYVGEESEAWKRFANKMLSITGGKSPGRVGVLDPRFPEVREYLVQTYERVVGEWGFDGVKLDFIDSFEIIGSDPAQADGYAGRDRKSLPEAVDVLMKEINRRLRKINPDVLVEFRQRYMGPAIRQYGNMIRAADCPADMASNRRRICDLRLTSGSTAVHGDMLVWSADETPQGAALPILSSLFGVIQYSMVLDTIPQLHCEVVRHWLGFSQKHRDTLLRGDFRPHNPHAGYPLVEAESPHERIVAVYVAGTAVRSGALDKPVYVVNATHGDSLVVDVADDASVEFFDAFGKKVSSRAVGKGLGYLPVPSGGYALVTGVR
jgi:alpha-galactosidase